jgi:hypothetical protein
MEMGLKMEINMLTLINIGLALLFAANLTLFVTPHGSWFNLFAASFIGLLSIIK